MRRSLSSGDKHTRAPATVTRLRKWPGLDQLARGHLICRTRAERRAQRGNAAGTARGPASVTDTATVPDHAMGSRRPLPPGQERADVLLDLFRIGLRRPAKPPR